MTDVKDPGTATASVLDVGFRVPLFDLVYHDCVVTTVHWSRTHNKLLYAWTLNDQFAMLRGQSPLLNLVYDGATGSIGRAITGATDARDGSFWDTRWTNPLVRDRVVQTFNTVCNWHRQIGTWEMTDSKVLSSDFAVQLSEFSPDAGASGKGIIVNFGTFDGVNSMSGPAWTGTVRGQQFIVPVGSFATYQWSACPLCAADYDNNGGVDGGDLGAFFADFEAGETCADVDGNGGVDGGDLGFFFTVFEAGGC